ncbi:MAG TPA: CNNM domain-containing protein [Candidatus Saccharimonadales bacterium]|nr:CNNM domain-containing protein [Candidatus Saccharimonadales bacterium]
MNHYVVALIVIILIAMSALCSGLNIALMSLHLPDLRRKAKLGNRAAKRVLPLRQNVNLTLASILITNVAVVSATPLILHDATNGWIAGIMSTLLIVIFGEILPQAWFSRHALAMTSLFVPMLRLMVVASYVVAKPLQLLLDKVLGHETPLLQSRHELGMMIGEHADGDSELDEDEVEIMQGALQLSEKRVRDIMTPIRRTYWLMPDEKITSARIDEIKTHNRSRIPIFNRELTKCYGLLLMKDLVGDDFDDQEYIIEDLPLHSCQIVGSMMALDTLFRKFISSGTHLIPVEKDDKIVGIVTIEDLIEEIVGHEIEDEADRLRSKQRVRAAG